MAIVEVPFVYDAEIVWPRHRNTDRIKVLAKVPVRIREVASDAAPVAVRFQRDYQRFQGEPYRVALDYRALDGQLLRPYSAGMVMPGDNAPHVPVTLDGVQADFDAVYARVGEASREQGRSVGFHYTLLPEFNYIHHAYVEDGPHAVTVRRWVAHNRDEAAARVRQVLEREAAFIDGVLHVPSKGPAWVVRDHPQHVRISKEPYQSIVERFVTIATKPEFGVLHGNDLKDGFRPDRREEAIAQARRRIAELTAWNERERRDGVPNPGRTIQEPIFDGALEVLDARALVLDDHLVSLCLAVESLLIQNSEAVGNFDPELIHAYADLKQMLAATRAATGDAGLDFDCLLMAARDLNERMAAAQGKDPNAHWNPVSEFLRRHEAALALGPAPDLDAGLLGLEALGDDVPRLSGPR